MLDPNTVEATLHVTDEGASIGEAATQVGSSKSAVCGRGGSEGA